MTEEEKAIKWLEKNTKNYSLSGEELHYSLILFYLIINLQQKKQKYKEAIDKIYSIINYEYNFYDDITNMRNDIDKLLKEVE